MIASLSPIELKDESEVLNLPAGISVASNKAEDVPKAADLVRIFCFCVFPSTSPSP